MLGAVSTSQRVAIVVAAAQKRVPPRGLLAPSGSRRPSGVAPVFSACSSAVQGLDAKNVPVADTSGPVLSAPGAAGAGTTGDPETRQRQDLEATLTSDV